MREDSQYNINELLRLVAKEDEQAFRIVFDHFKGIFYATAFKMTRSVVISEGIVQEVFVSLWIKRDLIAAAEKPESYLFTILHNCISAQFRKLAQERRLELKLEEKREDSENSIEALLIEKEDRAVLENVINQLPPQQRLIYKLAKREGVSREEIARQLNISPNTVRNHLAAAVQHLRVCFNKSVSAAILIFMWIRL